MVYILIILAILHLILCLISFSKIRKSNKTVYFIYQWASVFGAFVWEDLLIFSLFNLLTVLIVILFHDLRPGLVLIMLFWIIRSAGESIYFMLQQFIEPKHHPHEIDAHFTLLRNILGDISKQQCFIIMQVIHQVNVVIWLAGLFFIFLNWNAIISWF